MPGPVQSIERAAAVLQLLARGPRQLGISEIAAALGLARPTAHGIVRTMLRIGFVEQDAATGKYRLGPELARLGDGYLDVNELRSRAINWADALAARSGEAVRIGTLRDAEVLVVHHVFRPDDSPQALDVGARLPLHATALGKVLLAFDTGPPAELVPFSSRTITSPRTLARALAEVREAGWAAEVEEFAPGEAAVAAPIRGRGGLPVGALGISGAVERICDSRGRPRPQLTTYVRDAARAVSRDLGASPW